MKDVLVGKSNEGAPVSLLLPMATRHGLIAGATGTGKTATLRLLAEAFSRNGVPVFTADVKGDLAGISQAGATSEKIQARLTTLGIKDYTPAPTPTVFWDVFGENGHPLRTTISEIGPILLSRLFDLNDTQEGVLHIAFKLADDEGMLLLDLKDLKAILTWMGENADEIQVKYGNVSKASVGAIQRDILTLETAGGDKFFGEPALKLEHLLQRDISGRGIVNVLDATKLVSNPSLYTTFLLWLLSELFEVLPEVGDTEMPKLVFFFDEAHLLFDSAPKALLEKVEQVTRLIRSKGVGVYYVTQNPLDIPDNVLGQLGNRFQHALRAFTPRDQKAVRAAAETFRQNPKLEIESVITELAVGEALVSVLDEKGIPTIVERTLICPAVSRMGAITTDERRAAIAGSPVSGFYDTHVDRESAFEKIQARKNLPEKKIEETEVEVPSSSPSPPRRGAPVDESGTHGAPTSRSSGGGRRDSVAEAFTKSVVRTVGGQIGRSIFRGIFGNLLGGRR